MNKKQYLTIVFVSVAASCQGQASYIPLGDLPGGGFGSSGAALSGDGNVATGWSITGDGLVSVNAYRWTQVAGMISLGQSNGTTFGNGLSTSGSYIVGSIEAVPGVNGVRGAFWSASGDFHMIGDLPGGSEYSILGDVSDNGVAVGASSYANGQFGPLQQAIRWTELGGLEALGFLPGDDYSFAVDISADGKKIAGRGSTGTWTWTEQAGMVQATGSGFDLQGMTKDGDFLFGVNSTILDGRTVGIGTLWSEDQGLIELDRGVVPDSWVSDVARAASLDAEVVLGMRFALADRNGAYIWFDQGKSGMFFEDYLLANGLDLLAEGYIISEVSGVSDDGTRFLVQTFNPDGNVEAVLITVPSPGVLAVLSPIGLVALRRRRSPEPV